MSRSQAMDILKAYGLVLRRVPLFTTALPQSLLCHDRHAIKRAIRVAMSFARDDEFTISTLEDAYGCLAFFVPDGEAAVVAQAQGFLGSEAGDHARSGFIDRTMRIKRRVRQDHDTLVEEFRGFREKT